MRVRVYFAKMAASRKIYRHEHTHTLVRNAPGVQNISEKSIRTIIGLYFICLSIAYLN